MNSFENRFFYNCVCAEASYNKLISLGYKPQQARVVLPLSVKAEGIMTGFASDWRHFFDLRAIGTTGAPHPQAKELAEPLMNEFINRKYI
jgi:thymidylate synthase (FAD)